MGRVKFEVSKKYSIGDFKSTAGAQGRGLNQRDEFES